MNSISKLLILSGIVLIALGLLWHFGGKFLPLGRLPGDIVIEKKSFKFYFPVATSILLSILVSLLVYLFRHFKNR